MRRLRRIAIIATCLSAFSIFVISNTFLAKPPFGRPCIVVFYLPFTNKDFQLPMWMWGAGPLLVLAISTLTAIGCWMTLFLKRRSNIRVEGHA
jgi:hypothetical protein